MLSRLLRFHAMMRRDAFRCVGLRVDKKSAAGSPRPASGGSSGLHQGPSASECGGASMSSTEKPASGHATEPRRRPLPVGQLAVLIATLLAFGGSALAQGTPSQGGPSPVIRFLDSIPPKEGGITYGVVPGSDLVLPLIIDKGGKLEFFLSQFRSEHGDALSIPASIDGLADSSFKDG